MRKIISFMHISLDGFVAGPNGEMSWIKVDDELFDHVEERISQSDTALYGRITYQMMENYWPTAADKPSASKHDIEHSKWYKKIRKVVLSKSLDESRLVNTQVIGDDVADSIKKLKEGSDGAGKEILIFGSPTATHALMQMNLVDGYWLFVNPIVLGSGTRLFEGISEQVKLQLMNTRRFTNGVTELDYVVDRQ